MDIGYGVDFLLEPFKIVTGIVAPIDRVNVDTDQIVPKQFLKLTQKTGYGQYLFYDWRYDIHGNPRHEFVLNQPRYHGSKVLLARANFGSGSSREHAVWAILEYGFRVVIAPSFSDIFYNNCLQNGVLPISLSDEKVEDLFRKVYSVDGYYITVNLEEQSITGPEIDLISFDMEPFPRKKLLEGLDEVAWTLQHEKHITKYETRRWDSNEILAISQRRSKKEQGSSGDKF